MIGRRLVVPTEYIPLEHERTFVPKPIGVTYTCEKCNDGDMVLDTSVKPDFIGEHLMFKHICTNPTCDCTMMLPKQYPYVEWVKEET